MKIFLRDASMSIGFYKARIDYFPAFLKSDSDIRSFRIKML